MITTVVDQIIRLIILPILHGLGRPFQVPSARAVPRTSLVSAQAVILVVKSVGVVPDVLAVFVLAIEGLLFALLVRFEFRRDSWCCHVVLEATSKLVELHVRTGRSQNGILCVLWLPEVAAADKAAATFNIILQDWCEIHWWSQIRLVLAESSRTCILGLLLTVRRIRQSSNVHIARMNTRSQQRWMIAPYHELIALLHLNARLVSVLLYLFGHLDKLFAPWVSVIASGPISQLVWRLIVSNYSLLSGLAIDFFQACEMWRRKAADNWSSTLTISVLFDRWTYAIEVLLIIFLIDIVQDRRHALKIGYKLKVRNLFLLRSLLSMSFLCWWCVKSLDNDIRPHNSISNFSILCPSHHRCHLATCILQFWSLPIWFSHLYILLWLRLAWSASLFLLFVLSWKYLGSIVFCILSFVLVQRIFGFIQVLINSFNILLFRIRNRTTLHLYIRDSFSFVPRAGSGNPWIFSCRLSRFIFNLCEWCSLAAGFALWCLALSVWGHFWVWCFPDALWAQFAWCWRCGPCLFAEISIFDWSSMPTFSQLPHVLLTAFCRVLAFLRSTIWVPEALISALPSISCNLDCGLASILYKMVMLSLVFDLPCSRLFHTWGFSLL